VNSNDRLRLVTEAARLTIDATPIPLPSDSNDVWKIGDLVLRICWRGDRSRLQREALLLEHLPSEVPHARLADSGLIDDLAWTLTHWVPGTTLSDTWVTFDRAQQRIAAEQFGHALHALHAWEPPPQIRAALASHTDQLDTSDVIGAALNPLPVDRALRLIEPATHLENIDQHLIDQLEEELKRLRPIDPLSNPSEGVVVHGDASLNNVVWDGTQFAALLDFEWVRLGPPDLEIQPLLVFDDAATLIRTVIEAYPAIAAHPQFAERLWLYDLSATLRDLLVKSPLPATSDLPLWHPKKRLPIVLAGPGYIETLLNRT
jgi:aminoglycoside phosphotransferase (APT) family kinase protein